MLFESLESLGRVEQVAAVVMETDGSFSVIPAGDERLLLELGDGAD